MMVMMLVLWAALHLETLRVVIAVVTPARVPKLVGRTGVSC